MQAVVIGVMIALIAGECGIRVYVASRGWTANCYTGSLTLNVPDPVNGYTLAKSYRFRSGAYAISTNAHGLRDDDLPQQKPLTETRIAILGGSSVFGYLVSDQENASAVLEQMLQQRGHNVQVLNAGVPGYNLLQTTHRYQHVVSRFQPDIVVLYLGWNDLPYLLDEDPSPGNYQSGPCPPWWQRFLSHSTLYGFVFHRLLSPAAEFNPPVSAGAEPTQQGVELFESRLHRLVSLIQESGARVIVCSQATLGHPDVEESALSLIGNNSQQIANTVNHGQWLRTELESFARKHELKFIDVYNRIRPTTEMLGDAIHLTEQGESKLAQILAADIESMLDITQ